MEDCKIDVNITRQYGGEAEGIATKIVVNRKTKMLYITVSHPPQEAFSYEARQDDQKEADQTQWISHVFSRKLKDKDEPVWVEMEWERETYFIFFTEFPDEFNIDISEAVQKVLALP